MRWYKIISLFLDGQFGLEPSRAISRRRRRAVEIERGVIVSELDERLDHVRSSRSFERLVARRSDSRSLLFEEHSLPQDWYRARFGRVERLLSLVAARSSDRRVEKAAFLGRLIDGLHEVLDHGRDLFDLFVELHLPAAVVLLLLLLSVETLELAWTTCRLEETFIVVEKVSVEVRVVAVSVAVFFVFVIVVVFVFAARFVHVSNLFRVVTCY